MRHSLLLASGLMIAVSMLASCKKDNVKKVQPEEVGHVEATSYQDFTADDGFIRVPVTIEAGQTAFQVTASRQADNRWVYVERLIDPDGNVLLNGSDWWYLDESLNYGFIGDFVGVLNWPIRGVDPGLIEGEYEVWLSVTNYNYNYLGNEPLDIDVVTKRDQDLGSGTVHARIIWAQGVDDDPAIKAGVEAAVDEWRTIWGGYGLTLGEVYQSSNLDPDMAWYDNDFAPGLMGDLSQKELGELVLVVGDTVDGDFFTYGISGGIPGSVATTGRSHVVVSTMAHAGVDGTLDAEDISVMAETMAHEVGHYMGLFHVVEGGYQSYDAIEDTPRCNNQNRCESQLGTNNMYPYSLCDNQGCERQRQMTPGQLGVSNRYLATD